MSRKKYQKNDITFGGRLRTFRKLKGEKVVNFSKLLGISQSSLSSIENNINKPSVLIVAALLQKTDINIEWLLTGEGLETRSEIANAGVKENVSQFESPGADKLDDDFEISELLSMTRTVLKSGTGFSHSLSANIRSFHHSIELEHRIKKLEDKILEVERPDRRKIIQEFAGSNKRLSVGRREYDADNDGERIKV